MKNDLIERYIYAVTKQLSQKNREDVSMELRGLIDDMLMERCGEQEPAEKDIRVVLTELGSPQELYGKYAEDADKCLIGQPYYSTYKLTLKAILAAIIGGLTVACVILQIMEPRSWGEFAAFLLGNLVEGAVVGYAVITLLFTVMQAKGMKLNEKFSLDNLPAVPKKKQQISLGEAVADIAFIAVFLVVFLVVPQIFSAVIPATGELIPIFSIEVIQSAWYILALFALAGIVRECVKLMEKRYNKRVLIATIASNIVSAFCAIWWLCRDNILNPAFLQKMDSVIQNDAAFLGQIFGRFNLFLMAVMLLALAMDTIDVILKTEKA